MKYLPFRKYKIVIPYKPSQFEELIIMELSRSWKNEKSFFKTTKPTFKGQVINGNFELYRRGFGNTSMVPKIKGQIFGAADDKLSIIEMNIGFNLFTKSFLIFWFSFVVIVFLISLINAVINWKFNIGIPVSIGMVLIAYGMTMLTFSEEEKTIKRFFYEKWFIRIE